MASEWPTELPTPWPIRNGNGHAAFPEPEPEPALSNGISFGAMKGQATQADARAERLMRQVRVEVDELRTLLDGLNESQHEMTVIDLQAFLRNPDAAATLPAAMLVRTLVSAAERLNEAEAELARARDESLSWERQAYSLREERAALRARSDTFSEVAAALHANLEDLRFARDSARAIQPGAYHPQLNAGPDR
ncbi:MAG: hypothetical protein HY875_11860 [Chloroflexi bacterium]|nr:hypothetical protein [Chloroflexota bacterium]